MAMAESDRRLVREFLNAAERARAYPLESARAKKHRDEAVDVLVTYGQEFDAAVKREDTDEIRADTASADLVSAREETNEVFGDVRNGLDIRLKELAIARAPVTKKTRELRAFIDGYSASDFSKTPTNIIVAVLERAQVFTADFLPDHLRPTIEARLAAVLARLEDAQTKADARGAQVKGAYSDLLEARVDARREYLNARDLMSVALRIEQREADLNSVIPTLEVAVLGRQKPAKKADTPDDAQEPEDLPVNDGGQPQPEAQPEEPAADLVNDGGQPLPQNPEEPTVDPSEDPVD